MIQNTAEIRSSAAIADVVGQFLPKLKPSGSNLVACCPFHQERTPSFNVNPARNIYKCFGCGKGGDAVTFLMEGQGMTYPDALRWLARRYSIEVQESAGAPDPERDHKTQLRTWTTVLQAHFALTEVDETPGRRYWLERGFQPETLDEFGVGWCDGSKPAHLDDAALSAIGAVNEAGNLIFYKRTTIPIHDRHGAVVAWAGRALDTADKAKYINSPETPIYSKSATLFNLHRAAPYIRQRGEVWIVEGYADAMALWQAGIRQVVALCGTALTEQQAAELKKFNGERPLRCMLALDNEISKGKDNHKPQVEKAYRAALERLLPFAEVLHLEYPAKCKDMADVVQRGIEPGSLQKTDAITRYVAENFDKDFREQASPVEKAEFQERIARMIAAVRKENVRDIYINTLCNSLELSARSLAGEVKKVLTENETEQRNRVANEYKFIKVGDEYYERQIDFDIFTRASTVVYVRRKRLELGTEGVSYSTLPRFHNWICEPSHLEYRRIIEVPHENEVFRFFNSYQPLPHKEKAFELPEGFVKDPAGFDYELIPEIRHTARFFKHIFDHAHHGARYLSLGWDWLALCYLLPTQRLPALALVSSEEGTGKSTFINLMLAIFGQNATKTDALRIAHNFNAMMAGKVLTCVEETKDQRGEVENILKDLITAFEQVIEPKHQDARVVKSFGKFIFASNHEDSFMKVGIASTRFFVMKVHPIQGKEPDFEEKLYREIPYLLHFLRRRTILSEKQDRLWFDPKLLENEALLKLRHASKDQVQQVMEELINLIFLRCELSDPLLYLSSAYLKLLMVRWGGKVYEQKTPQYFQTTAEKSMRVQYNDNPSRRVTIELQGIQSDAWINADAWTYEQKRVQARFLEFPIWQFVQPGEVAANYTETRLGLLIDNLNNEAAALREQYGEAPILWLQALLALTQTPEPALAAATA